MADKKSRSGEISRIEKGLGDQQSSLLQLRSHRWATARAESAAGSILSQVENSPGASVLAYCLSSMSMTVVNKFVVSGSSWNLNFLYLTIQLISVEQAWICMATILVLKQMGMLPNLVPLRAITARKWLPVSIGFVGMIYTSTKSLQYLPVPVYTIFKNLTIIVIAYGEILWFGGKVTSLILLAFGLMVLSSIVAAWSDIQAVFITIQASKESVAAVSVLNTGYIWMGLNIICSASYVLGTRKYITSMHFKEWDAMLYNNSLCIPITLLCSMLTEDWSSTNLSKNFPAESRNNLVIGMLYSGIGAVVISYSSAWCIRKTSSTTYSFVGYLNKLPLAVSGIVLFNDPATFRSISAILLGFLSGLIYGYGKVKQKEDAKRVLPTAQPTKYAGS